jgi:hypothetical protein
MKTPSLRQESHQIFITTLDKSKDIIRIPPTYDTAEIGLVMGFVVIFYPCSYAVCWTPVKRRNAPDYA